MNLKESIRKILKEVSESVTCECGWSWKISEGGDDPYVCHKCWKDNSKEYLKEKKEVSLQEPIRRILREVFDSKSTFKRNVYGGEEEYREVTKNRTVIWNPEYNIAFQYIFDDREVPGYTFVHLYPYTEGRYNYEWEELDNSVKSKIFIDAIKKLPKVLKNYFKKFGKLDKVVFRPKTGQMGNIYSSPSVIRILQSEFGTDYNIEVNEEDKKSLPVNTVIMTLKNIVKESEDDFNWIKDVNPSLLDSIIVFEPMITEEDYGKILEVLELDEDIHTMTGHINTLDPFYSYGYLHHLLIDARGKTVYGGSNVNDEEYNDLNYNINDYVSTFSHRFPNPTRIDGRKYFNI